MSPYPNPSSSLRIERLRRSRVLAGLLAGSLAACSEAPSAVGSLPAPAPSLEVAHQSLIAIPADSEFYGYRCQGASPGDVSGDPVTGNRERDMVGDNTYPAFFRAANANYVFFRMRIDANPLKNNGVDLQPSSWDVLVDTDGDLRTYEFMLTADGNMAGTKVRWVRNSSQNPADPRDPAGDSMPADLLADFSPVTDYYNVKVATDGSKFSGDADYFVTLVIPKTTLQAAGLNLNNSFVVWGGTNAQNYSLNADFGCFVGIPTNLADAATLPGPLDPAGTPDAIDDTATSAEDSSVTTTVLANDTGLRDAPISVTITKQPLHGTAVVNPDNTVTYTPAANYNGPDSYTYRVTDADGQTDTANIAVTVTPVNDNPTGAADTFSVPTTSTGTRLDVLANDSSAPDSGETLTVSAVSQPSSGGSVSISPDNGAIIFTPTPGFTGPVSFTYTVSDGNGGSSVVTVSVNVLEAGNSPPTVVNDSVTVNEDSGATVVDVLANDSDPEGSPLSVQSVTQPAAGGSVELGSDGKVRFTPAPDFNGDVTFSYTVSDGNGGTNTATVTVHVLAVNDAPTAVADSVTMTEDSGATVVDVLANDSDPESDSLSVQSVTQPASGGTVALGLDGKVRFTPAPDFYGDVTFSYTVSDGKGGTASANVTVHVTSINDLPTGGADTFSVPSGSGATTLDVLANDTASPDTGEVLTISGVTQPTSGGTVSVAADGRSLVFTPAPGFTGSVTFSYTLSDGNGGTVTVPVTVNVGTAGNAPPVARNDEATVDEDSGDTVVDVLANDSDPEGNPLSVTAVTQPAQGGTVTLVDGKVHFTPAPNFNGPVTFTYTVSDGNSTSTGTVTLTVSPVNDAPTGVADTFHVTEGSGAVTLDVLANDSSAPDANETLSVIAVTQPAQGGTVAVAADGQGVVFTPTPGYVGPVTFSYTVSDGHGGSTTVTVTVNVGALDSDGDGIEDSAEIELGTNPNNPDTDGDGVPDGTEVKTGTSPRDDDSDDDGIMDGNEDSNHNGVVDPGETNPRSSDSDGDGLSDGLEKGLTQAQGRDTDPSRFTPDADPSTTTDPFNPDSDGDGLHDGVEDANHDGRVGNQESDPNDADTDDGGLLDGEEAKAGTKPYDYSDDLAVAGRGCSATGTGSLLPLLLLLAVPLLRRRQAHRGSTMAWGVLGLLAVVFGSAPASAQTSAQASQGIDVQQYKPGPSFRDVLGLHSAQVGKHLDWNLGLSLNYAKDPLNFLRTGTDDFVFEIVKNQFTFDLMGSVALFERFELGVALPITTQGSASAASVSPLLSDGLQATGVGDLRLVPKAHLLSMDNGLRLGVAVPLLLPTSGGKEFLGRTGVAASPRVLGEWVGDNGLRVLANVGVNLQPAARFYNLNVGPEFAYGLGAEMPFQVRQHRLAAEASVMGSLGLKETNSEESPLELLAAVKYHFTDSLAAHLGGGPGLTRGYGTPGFRLFAGVMWTEATRAIPARIEPVQPAPAPAPAPAPVADTDQDGINDDSDRCVNAAETRNGFEDSDGCPDELPPPPPVDSDGDGLTDDQDRCPMAAEDKDGFEDSDGCPDLDNDKDGVPDASDKCPNEPETINGSEDEDGCPDKGKEKVRVEGQRIVILDKVYFATGKDVILARSFPLLKQVAQVLRGNAQLLKVRVEGHTDSQGAEDFNLDLSQRRANSVRKYLIEQEGIAAERLEAVGYGETKPVDTNATAVGRENNRRVEFTILEVKEQ